MGQPIIFKPLLTWDIVLAEALSELKDPVVLKALGDRKSRSRSADIRRLQYLLNNNPKFKAWLGDPDPTTIKKHGLPIQYRLGHITAKHQDALDRIASANPTDVSSKPSLQEDPGFLARLHYYHQIVSNHKAGYGEFQLDPTDMVDIYNDHKAKLLKNKSHDGVTSHLSELESDLREALGDAQGGDVRTEIRTALADVDKHRDYAHDYANSSDARGSSRLTPENIREIATIHDEIHNRLGDTDRVSNIAQRIARMNAQPVEVGHHLKEISDSLDEINDFPPHPGSAERYPLRHMDRVRQLLHKSQGKDENHLTYSNQELSALERSVRAVAEHHHAVDFASGKYLTPPKQAVDSEVAWKMGQFASPDMTTRRKGLEGLIDRANINRNTVEEYLATPEGKAKHIDPYVDDLSTAELHGVARRAATLALRNATLLATAHHNLLGLSEAGYPKNYIDKVAQHIHERQGAYSQLQGLNTSHSSIGAYSQTGLLGDLTEKDPKKRRDSFRRELSGYSNLGTLLKEHDDLFREGLSPALKRQASIWGSRKALVEANRDDLVNKLHEVDAKYKHRVDDLHQKSLGHKNALGIHPDSILSADNLPDVFMGAVRSHPAYTNLRHEVDQHTQTAKQDALGKLYNVQAHLAANREAIPPVNVNTLSSNPVAEPWDEYAIRTDEPNYTMQAEGDPLKFHVRKNKEGSGKPAYAVDVKRSNGVYHHGHFPDLDSVRAYVGSSRDNTRKIRVHDEHEKLITDLASAISNNESPTAAKFVNNWGNLSRVYQNHPDQDPTNTHSSGLAEIPSQSLREALDSAEKYKTLHQLHSDVQEHSKNFYGDPGESEEAFRRRYSDPETQGIYNQLQPHLDAYRLAFGEAKHHVEEAHKTDLSLGTLVGQHTNAAHKAQDDLLFHDIANGHIKWHSRYPEVTYHGTPKKDAQSGDLFDADDYDHHSPLRLGPGVYTTKDYRVAQNGYAKVSGSSAGNSTSNIHPFTYAMIQRGGTYFDAEEDHPEVQAHITKALYNKVPEFKNHIDINYNGDHLAFLSSHHGANFKDRLVSNTSPRAEGNKSWYDNLTGFSRGMGAYGVSKKHINEALADHGFHGITHIDHYYPNLNKHTTSTRENGHRANIIFDRGNLKNLYGNEEFSTTDKNVFKARQIVFNVVSAITSSRPDPEDWLFDFSKIKKSVDGFESSVYTPNALTHWSKQPRELIDPNKQGTAYAGAEVKRRGRIPRTYYYSPKSAYTEPGIANPTLNVKHDIKFRTGEEPRLVNMENLPQGMLTEASKRSGSWSGPEQATALEHIIHEHGYDGYHRDGIVALYHPVLVDDGTGYSSIFRNKLHKSLVFTNLNKAYHDGDDPLRWHRVTGGGEDSRNAHHLYSGLGHLIETRMPASMQAEQLRAFVKAQGVTDDEMNASGLHDLEGKVTPNQVVDHIRAYKPNIQIKKLVESSQIPLRWEEEELPPEGQRYGVPAGVSGRHTLYHGDEPVAHIYEHRHEVDSDTNAYIRRRREREEAQADRFGESVFDEDGIPHNPNSAWNEELDHADFLTHYPHGGDSESNDDLDTAKHTAEAAIRDMHDEYDDDGSGSGDKTVHENYTMPGGENYQEHLLINPESDFKHGHWQGRTGVFAHLRMKDRTDGDGKNTLNVQEVQSDLHQEGRTRGYSTEENQAKIAQYTKNWHEAREAKANFIADHAHMDTQASSDLEYAQTPEYRQHLGKKDDYNKKIQNAKTAYDTATHEGAMPSENSLFKGDSWHQLAIKHALHHAAVNGYDRLSISPPEIQNNNYLTKPKEGQARHYGKTYPDYLNKLGRAFGTTTGKSLIGHYDPTTATMHPVSPTSDAPGRIPIHAHHIDIHPEMAEHLSKFGMSLWGTPNPKTLDPGYGSRLSKAKLLVYENGKLVESDDKPTREYKVPKFKTRRPRKIVVGQNPAPQQGSAEPKVATESTRSNPLAIPQNIYSRLGYRNHSVTENPEATNRSTYGSPGSHIASLLGSGWSGGVIHHIGSNPLASGHMTRHLIHSMTPEGDAKTFAEHIKDSATNMRVSQVGDPLNVQHISHQVRYTMPDGTHHVAHFFRGGTATPEGEKIVLKSHDPRIPFLNSVLGENYWKGYWNPEKKHLWIDLEDSWEESNYGDVESKVKSEYPGVRLTIENESSPKGHGWEEI